MPLTVVVSGPERSSCQRHNWHIQLHLSTCQIYNFWIEIHFWSFLPRAPKCHRANGAIGRTDYYFYWPIYLDYKGIKSKYTLGRVQTCKEKPSASRYKGTIGRANCTFGTDGISGRDRTTNLFVSSPMRRYHSTLVYQELYHHT